MSDFEPYLGKFHEVQPDLAKMVKDEYNIVDLFNTAAENREIQNISNTPFIKF